MSRGYPSRPEHGPAGAGEEAGLDEERQELALGDGLAVEALHRQPLAREPAGVVDEGGERDAETVGVGIFQRDERAPAALDEQHRPAAEQDDVGTGDARRSRSRALGPWEDRAVWLRGIGGGEH